MPRPDPGAAASSSPAVIDPGAVRDLATRLGLALNGEQVERLVSYGRMLERWNRTYNLTALRDPGQILSHHLADCLAVLPPLQRRLAASPVAGEGSLLDVGSGGGLPGVVLAIGQPTLQVTCVDTVGKKAAFVRQVGVELGLANLRSVHARVEAMSGRFDIVASRAFATLADFVAVTRGCLAPGGVWMAMKGQRPVDEIASLPTDVEVFHVEPLTVPGLDAERCLVWMTRHQDRSASGVASARRP